MNTDQLIASLSQEARKSPLRPPSHYAVRAGVVLLIYAFGAQYVLGVRPDIMMQLARPMFVLEVFLLFLLVVASAGAAVVLMYPDLHQKRWALRLHYGVFAILLALFGVQFFLPVDERMVFPPPGAHSIECALCIAAVSLVPSALLFALLRKGASVHAIHAGAAATLAATGIGCLTLRLAEANDSLLHLLGWHYLPTLMFAALGARIGKWLLKW